MPLVQLEEPSWDNFQVQESPLEQQELGDPPWKLEVLGLLVDLLEYQERQEQL
jgi:hypothetical protein